jgi:exopolyphosphatase/guanosine-5'-triphosphate,3'-diphosphate pyrophosphatase
MDMFELPGLEVCPWALREGVILRRLDALPSQPARNGG